MISTFRTLVQCLLITYVLLFHTPIDSWRLPKQGSSADYNVCRLQRKVAAIALQCFVAVNYVSVAGVSAADSDSFQQQLRSFQKAQVTQQRSRLDNQRAADISLSPAYNAGNQIAKAVVTIPELETSIDQTQYPLGIEEATSLDTVYSNDRAALIITAVGKEGQPIAAKKFKLKDVRFPVFVQLTADQNLMFPYTKDAWLSSSNVRKGISITAILDEDGRLQTSEASDRFGFAISDVSPSTGKRLEAQLNINFKSDGAAYSEDDLDLLSRIDQELERIGFASIP